MRLMNTLVQAQAQRVGRQIKKARLQAGYSHDVLANKAGTGRQHLIKLEKGQHLVGPALLTRIAEATGKTLEFFGSDDDDDDESHPVTLDDLLRSRIDSLVRESLKSNAPDAHLTASTSGASTQGE